MTNPLRRVRPAGAGPGTPPPVRDMNTVPPRPSRDTLGDYRPTLVSFVPWPGGDVSLAINAGTFVRLPIRDQRLTPEDSYRLTFRSPGRRDHVETLFGLVPGSRITVDITPDLMPVRAGLLVVTANARGATVSVDNGPASASPFSGVFREGAHKVKVSAPGFQTETLDVAVADGRTARVNVAMVAAGVPRVVWVTAALLAGALIGGAVAAATQPSPPQQPALPPAARPEGSPNTRGARRRKAA
jgi:hypothetical protein